MVSSTVLRTAMVGGGGLVKRIRQSYSMYEIGGNQATGGVIEGWGRGGEMGMKIRSSEELNELRMLENEMRPFQFNDISTNSNKKIESYKHIDLPTHLETQRKQVLTFKKSRARQNINLAKNIKHNLKQSNITTYAPRKHSLSKIEENLFEDDEEYREQTRRTV